MGLNKTTAILITFFTLISMQNCTPSHFASVSDSENSALSTTNPFNAVDTVTSVFASAGNPADGLSTTSVADASANLTQDCSLVNPETERQAALKAAANDPKHLTIPVQYAISFGTKEDTLAYWAHSRAILSASNPGVTYIPVGPGQGSSINGTDSTGSSVAQEAYYVADAGDNKHGAYFNYKYGKHCYYDTIQVLTNSDGSPNLQIDPQSSANGENYYSFINQGAHLYQTAAIEHEIKYMWYGWCDPGLAGAQGCSQAATAAYGKGTYNYGNDVYPNRLFGTLPHTEMNNISGAVEPQIVKLYVADLRDGHLRGNGVVTMAALANPLISIPTNLARGDEVAMNVRQFLDLKTILRNRDQVILDLQSDYKSTDSSNGNVVFAKMDGMPQLLANLVGFGLVGTNLASQYTPIVLDLGDAGVMTSGQFNGTFFNMAAAFEPTVAGPVAFDQPQQTSWVGGEIVDVLGSNLATPWEFSFKHDFRRVTQDGFLAIPDADGQIRSSKNLFGNNMVVNGITYANGFLALQALTNKDCTSSDLTKKYFGPWDGNLYSQTVQIWVDANRNGVVDPGELQSLKSAGVVAINACNVVNAQATDTYGNGTSLRAAFLYQQGEDITGNQTEILNRISTGFTSGGKAATFRLAIDLIFQVNLKNNLYSSTNVVVPKATPTQVAASAVTARGPSSAH